MDPLVSRGGRERGRFSRTAVLINTALVLLLQSVAASAFVLPHALSVARGRLSKVAFIPRNNALLFSANDKNNVADNAQSQAEALRAQAQAARREAERMENELALEQIAKLERRLENAASTPAESGGGSNSNNTDENEQKGVEEKIAAMRKRLASNRETDLSRLLVGGDNSQYGEFNEAVAQGLETEAMIDTALWRQAAERVGLTDEQASAEAIASVANCMIIPMVDDAAREYNATGSTDSNATTIAKLDSLLHFMNSSSLAFDAFFEGRDPVIIEPVVYSGSAVNQSALNALFEAYYIEKRRQMRSGSDNTTGIGSVDFTLRKNQLIELFKVNEATCLEVYSKDLLDDPSLPDSSREFWSTVIPPLLASGDVDLMKEVDLIKDVLAYLSSERDDELTDDLKSRLLERAKTSTAKSKDENVTAEISTAKEFDPNKDLKSILRELEVNITDFEGYMDNRTIAELDQEEKQKLDEVREGADAIFEFFNEASADVEGIEELKNSTAFQEVFTMVNDFFGGNMTREELDNVVQPISSFLNSPTGKNFVDAVKSGTEQEREMQELKKKDPNIETKAQKLLESHPISLYYQRPDPTVVDRFVADVLMAEISTVFQPLEQQAQNWFHAYVLAGTNMMENGDALIDYLETRLKEMGLQDKLFVSYVKLPDKELNDSETESDFDAFGFGEDANLTIAFQLFQSAFESELPPNCLIFTGPPKPKKEYDKSLSQTLLVNVPGLMSVAYFASSCFDSFDPVGLASLFAAILAVQATHEVGRYAAGFIHNVALRPPTIFPWPWTGLFAVTSGFTSYPRNNNALFDVSAAGSILGMSASVASLVWGVQRTLEMSDAEISALPKLPLDVLEKTSWLVSSIIESLAGFDVLSSLDATGPGIPCHPLLIAGFIGILTNSFALLPVSNNDGGRMAKAVGGNGGFNLNFVFTSVVSNLFLLVQGFREWDETKLLISFYFLSNIIFSGEDLPCQNGIDKASGMRSVSFLAALLIAFTALSPTGLPV